MWNLTVCERIDSSESVSVAMKSSSQGLLIKHLMETELNHGIEVAQKANKTRLVQQLCIVKNLYQGDTRKETGDHVEISRSTTHRWAHAWNEGDFGPAASEVQGVSKHHLQKYFNLLALNLNSPKN